MDGLATATARIPEKGFQPEHRTLLIYRIHA